MPTRIDAKEGPPIPLSDAEDRPIPDADAETHDSETAGTDSETRDTGSGANAEGERAQGSIAPRDPAGVDARESAPPAPPISDPIREFSSDPEFRPTGSDRSATEKTGIGTLSNPAVTELRAGRSDSPRGDRIGSEVEPTAPPRTAPALGWLLAGTVAVLGLLAARSFRRDDTPDRNAADRGIAGPVSIVPLAAAVARARNRVASTPEEAVLLAYDELQVTLARQRKQRREHETPLEHQRRLVAFSAELRAPLGFLVGHVYDVVYGHRSLPPSELDRVRSSCEKIRRRLR